MKDGRRLRLWFGWEFGKRQLSAAAAILDQQHRALSHPRVLGLDILESRYGSEKENALRNAAQPRTRIMGSTPGSFARTRLIFMPHRRCYWALRILHLASMPAISLGNLMTVLSGFRECTNQLCLIRQCPKTLKAALLTGTVWQIHSDYH